MNTIRFFLLGLVVTAPSVCGCRSDVNTVIQPRVSDPTLEETSDYEREKQEMISERDLAMGSIRKRVRINSPLDFVCPTVG